MSAPDVAAWRRANSDPVSVEIVLVDGSSFKGSVLVQRGKHLREVFNGTSDDFIDFECIFNGPTIISKTAIRTVCRYDPMMTDQLQKRLTALEKADTFAVLGIGKDADRAAIRSAYIERARAYHPDRFAQAELPAEVKDYLNVMARRVNSAYCDLNALLGVES